MKKKIYKLWFPVLTMNEMKKMHLTFLFFLFIVLTTSFVEASCNMQNVVVFGYIKDGETGLPVEDAFVSSTCGLKTLSTITNNQGGYMIEFDKRDCSYGDKISIFAEKENAVSLKTEGYIQQIYPFGCAVRMDVPLIPEFGFFTGIMTIFIAITLFFIARK